MTISKTSQIKQYSGDGATLAFSFPYRFFADGDLDVYLTDSGGTDTLQTITTHYTVSNTGTESGGTITMVAAPASGETLTIVPGIAGTQSTDFSDNSAFPADDAETALDRLSLLYQQAQIDFARSLHVPTTNDPADSFEIPAVRANSFLKFDANGLPIAASTTDTTVGAFMVSPLASTTLAEFLSSTGMDDGITFAPQASDPSHSEGLLFYSDTEKALVFYNDEADIALSIGQEGYLFCRNATGATITNGQVVYISGASGNKPLISLADADTDATSKVIGLATHDIENNSNGYVTIYGLVRNLDTSAYAAGDVLYLSTTAGSVTDTLPGDGKYNYIVGTVVNNHATQGIIMVHPDRLARTFAQATWNTGTGTEDGGISPAKLDAKIEDKTGLVAGYAESGELTITTGGTVSFAHGLGVAPKMVQYNLVCKTTEANYAVNEVIIAPMYSGGVGQRSNTALIDSTNVTVRFSDQTGCFAVGDATTGAHTTLTNGNWKLVICAFG